MDANFVNIAIVVVYLVAMLAFGWWGKSRTKNNSDFLVAGRRLGPFLYTGTMAAVVLGGASTVGGVGLGYKFGISGMWLVVAIGAGVLLLSLLFAGTIQKLKIYTVSQMLTLRYGSQATQTSGIVMLAYTLMLCATSTGAYATIFVVLFGWDRCARHRHRRRHRAGLLHHRRHVVHHPRRPGPVRHQDRRHLLPDAALHAQRRRRPRRHPQPRRRQLLPDRRHRRADHHHLLRGLHPGPADRPGHLAARVHRQDPRRLPAGAAPRPASTASSTVPPAP